MSNTTITPGAGAGFFTTDTRPFVGSGSLTLSGVASSVVKNNIVVTLAGSAALLGIVGQLNLTLTPPVGSLALTGLTPALQLGAVSITPLAGSLALSGGSPAPLNLSIATVAGSATLTGVSSTLVSTRLLTPLTGAVLTSTGAATLGLQLAPLVGQVLVSGVSSTLRTGFTITTGVGSLSFVSVAPSLLTPTLIAVGTSGVSAQGVAPFVSAASVTITPFTGSVHLSGGTPLSPYNFVVRSGALTFSGGPPSVVATISFSNGYLLPLNGPVPFVSFPDYLLPEVA
jgi:hypothetical protein